MEKFSNWRDKGTGISPFMPTVQTNSSALSKIYIIPKCLLLMVKLPIFLLACIVYSVVPSQTISRFIAFVLFGLRKYDLTVEGIKRTRLNEIESAKPKVNDLVVVNYVSPIDALLVYIISNASLRDIAFLIPNSKGQLYEYSIVSFFNHTFSNEFGNETSKILVKDLSKYKNKLVYVFLEGTPSNNKAVLPFISISHVEIPAFFSIKTLVLKLQPAQFTLSIPILSRSAYLRNLMTNVNKNSLLKAKLYNLESFDIKEIKKSFELTSLNLIGNNLSITEKQNFYAYYINHEVKGTT